MKTVNAILFKYLIHLRWMVVVYLFLLSPNLIRAQILEAGKPPQRTNSVFLENVEDSLPSFPGGSDSLFNYVREHFQATPEMNTPRHQFILTIVGCSIDSNGIVTQVILEKPIDSSEFIDLKTETELLRVFKMMPSWIPGYKGGKRVNALVYIPMRFTIRNGLMKIQAGGPKNRPHSTTNKLALKISVIVVCSILFLVFMFKLV